MQDDEQTLEMSPELKARREKLRAYADQLLEATITLPMPDTHLESERAAKSVIATDRMLVVVFSDPKPVKPYEPRSYGPRTNATRSHSPSLRTSNDTRVFETKSAPVPAPKPFVKTGAHYVASVFDQRHRPFEEWGASGISVKAKSISKHFGPPIPIMRPDI